MKTVIFAVYHHMIKGNELTLIQQHKYYPMHKNTWCLFWQDKLHDICRYTVETRSAVFKSELKCLVDRLSNEMLLQRCLQGLSQNQNES